MLLHEASSSPSIHIAFTPPMSARRNDPRHLVVTQRSTLFLQIHEGSWCISTTPRGASVSYSILLTSTTPCGLSVSWEQIFFSKCFFKRPAHSI